MKAEFVFEKVGEGVFLVDEVGQVWKAWYQSFTERKGKNAEKSILRNLPYATFEYKF